MPLATASGPRPNVPKSLVVLIPSVLLLVLLVVISIILLIIGKGTGPVLQTATILAFLSCLVSGVLFWRVLPDFKISMQSFMQSQKSWKCRQCNNEWQN